MTVSQIQPKITANQPLTQTNDTKKAEMTPAVADSFEKTEKSAENKQELNKPAQHGKLYNFCKTFVTTGEYLKATGSTVIYGGIISTGLLAASWLCQLPKKINNEKALKDMLNKPLKSIKTSSKVIAGAVFAAIGGYEFAKAYLKVNKQIPKEEKKA